MQHCEPSLQALAERVAKLEKQNRRLKQAGIAALVVASAAVLMGQAQTSRVLEANSFHLKDATGRVRARLSLETADRPTLTFLDAKGSIVASLAGGDEPSLVLNRAGTNEQIQLGANRTLFGLGLYDKEIRAGLSVQNGSPALQLFDGSGKPEVVMGATRTVSSLFLTNPTGKESSMLWVDSFGNSRFNLNGSAGSLSVNLGEDAGGPSLQIRDNEGYSTNLGRSDLIITSTGRKERTPAASLVLFGRDQKVLWSAP